MAGCRKLVSVVVPVYNTAKYLERCVDSLVNQTYPDVDIILIDDGSTDSSGKLCDLYAEKWENISVVHRKNGGVSAARNTGIVRAKGDYIIFVDSDDCVHPELIEIYINALKLGGTLVCGVAGKESEIQISYREHWSDSVKNGDREHFMEFFLDDRVNPPWNKLYDAEIIHKYGIKFDEEKTLGEDLLFNLQYLRYVGKEYRIIQCPLYFYQEGRQGSLENSYYPQLFELQIELFEALCDFLQKCEVWSEENQKLYYQLYWNRLYLTIRIYKEYARTNQKQEINRKIQLFLENPIWDSLEQKCVYKGLAAWKHRIKRMHLEMLRKK